MMWTIGCLRFQSCMQISPCSKPLRCLPACRNGEMACLASGECIPPTALCDGLSDCSDGSDEANCTGAMQWRLTAGAHNLEGKVQVKVSGEWAPVCGSSVTARDASVICSLMNMGDSGRVLPFGEMDASRAWSVTCSNTNCRLNGSVPCGGKSLRISCAPRTTTTAPNVEDEQCGRRFVEVIARDPRKQRFARVVGGFETLPGAFPWTAAIRQRQGNAHHCGATVIHHKLLLTAAHCFDEDRNVNRYQAVVGDWDNSEHDGSEQILDVAEIIFYPKYKDLFKDDLAIVKLAGPGIVWDTNVQPICLPPIDFEYKAGNKCVVSGWGSLGNQFPQRLQAASLPILPRDQCISAAPTYRTLSLTAFCAGYLTGGIDSCQGDSGGPFACQNRDVFYLAGVISWGDGCAERDHPGIYTMVSPYVSWIRSVMRDQ